MRRRSAERRQVIPDPVYQDELVSRFVNAVMLSGKKSLAQRLVYSAFDVIEERAKEPGVEVFKKAVNNVAPLVEVRSRRVGGATYQVPVEVRPDRRMALAFRWIIQAASNRGCSRAMSRNTSGLRRPMNMAARQPACQPVQDTGLGPDRKGRPDPSE